MSTRTKEEELALDEKIARIQRKNEEILRRQKEIEEDKRMAEQQNAIVKLKPSTTNISRERTPALKPSNRELRHDIPEDFPEVPPNQRSVRGSVRGNRGGERTRGQGDWKVSGGPPPDPRSFLYDDERDGPVQDNTEQKREMERGRREERDRDNMWGGGREFQRGRRRGGMEYRAERGRRGGGGGGGGRRNEEEEWRAERMKIDEARIQRQRAADGKWRREWDNDKLFQEPLEEPRHEARKPFSPSHDKWSPPSQYHGQFPVSPDRHTRHSSRGGGMTPRGGRGRGRLDPAELEMPLEKIPVEVLHGQTSPRQKPSVISPAGDNTLRHPGGEVASPPSPLSPGDPTRSVACVGNTVKISIPNMGAAQSTPKPQRQAQEARGRFKSQPSYSSQSDDDTPRDRSHRGPRRQRNQKTRQSQDKSQDHQKKTSSDQAATETGLEALPVQNKPPLPPFRAEPKASAELKDPFETKDGDESWEDVTTSGTESMGEDLSSVNTSPLRRTVVNTMVISGKRNEAEEPSSVIRSLEFAPSDQPLDDSKNSYEEYLKELEIKETEHNLKDAGLGNFEPQIEDLDTSSLNISLDTSDNILLNMNVSEELSNEEKSNSATLLDKEEGHVSEETLNNLPQLESIVKCENSSKLVEEDVEEYVSGRETISKDEESVKENVPTEEKIAKLEDPLTSVETSRTNPSKEVLELNSTSTLNNEEDGQENKKVIEEGVVSKDDEKSAQNDCKVIENEDTLAVSGEISNIKDDKNVLTDVQINVKDVTNISNEIKVDEKNAPKCETEVVK